MPRATLQNIFSKLSVDKEARIVSGVKLLENNRDVTYKGADGKPMGFRTNDGLIDGLIGHAGNRTIPAHLTHDWTDGKQDGLRSRVGGHKNIRKDSNGDLIADFHAMPGLDGDRMLWLAENDPEHAMLSIVFDWNPIKTDKATFAVPLNFESGDFVAKGAGVTAMLQQIQTDTDMTKEEIVALIKENAASKQDVTDAVKAALSSVITTEESDKRIKAALSEFKPETAKLSEAEMDALLVKAEAKLVAKLGSGPLLQNIVKANAAADVYTATLAKYVSTSPNKALAIGRMLKDHPELSDAHDEHLQTQVAQLQSA